LPDSLAYTPALEERTLLDELNHRIKNELASVINLVTFKAVWTGNIDAKEELSNVVDLLHQHVQVHSILTMPDRDALVDAGEQLRKLGLAMSRCKLDRMKHPPPVVGRHVAAGIGAMLALALAIYELVTNAVRHACFNGRDGEIKIRLMRAGSWVNCRVTDNGSGLGRIKPGRGLRIVGDLAKSLGGQIDHGFGVNWTSFRLDFPLTLREQRANRVVAARRRVKTMPPLPASPAAGGRTNPISVPNRFRSKETYRC
jgi:two-component sensor histidine kinase